MELIGIEQIENQMVILQLVQKVMLMIMDLIYIISIMQRFGDFLLRAKAEPHDPYDNRFYRLFDRLLGGMIRWRWGVVRSML